jgi:hypothetical protein
MINREKYHKLTDYIVRDFIHKYVVFETVKLSEDQTVGGEDREYEDFELCIQRVRFDKQFYEGTRYIGRLDNVNRWYKEQFKPGSDYYEYDPTSSITDFDKNTQRILTNIYGVTSLSEQSMIWGKILEGIYERFD